MSHLTLFKFIFLLGIVFYSIDGTFAIELPFCQEKETSVKISSLNVDEALILNASYEDIGKSLLTSNASQICTCSIYPTRDVEALYLGLKYTDTSLITSKCRRSIYLTDQNGDVLHRFGCENSTHAYKVSKLSANTTLYLDLKPAGNSSLADTDSSVMTLRIAPDVTTGFHVSCGTPYTQGPGGPITLTNTQLSTTTGTTSGPVIANGGANNSAMIAGVVVGLGLMFLVVITCLLCYIARRKRKEATHSLSQRQPQSPPQINIQTKSHTRFHHRLQRKVTGVYNRIRGRPLPEIPAISRINVPEQNRESGLYSSIRLDASQRAKRDLVFPIKTKLERNESNDSGGCYIHACSLTRQCEAMPDLVQGIKEDDPHIGTVGNGQAIIPPLPYAENTRESKYANLPGNIYVNGKVEKVGDVVSNLYVDMNGRAGHDGEKSTTETQVKQLTLKAPLTYVDSHGYVSTMTKHSRNILQDSTNQTCRDIPSVATLKSCLVQVDSHGYVPMKTTLQKTAQLPSTVLVDSASTPNDDVV